MHSYVFRWYFYGISMVLIWYSSGISMYFYCISVYFYGIPLYFYDSCTVFLWPYYDLSSVLPLYFYDITMI